MMLRPRSFWSSAWLAGLLVSSSGACGGTSEGLFSDVGGSSGITHGGSTAVGGRASSVGGTASTGANPSSGSTNDAGSSSGGTNSATGGAGSSSSGSASGGAANGGSGAGGTSESGGAGGSIGGSGTGGNGGFEAGGTSAGGASAGSNAGGISGGGSANGGATTGGTSGDPSCAQLLDQAAKELLAAQACDGSHAADACAGRVSTTCGCQVPVDSLGSAETQEYLATLKQIQTRPCNIACSALACLPITRAECTSKGPSGGTCIAIRGPIAQ